jgi:hypothetical protein
MANRRRPHPRVLTLEEQRSFCCLIEDEKRWLDFEEGLKQVAAYGVDLQRLLKVLGRAHLDHKNWELQESRRNVMDWLIDVRKHTVRLRGLADRLWKETGHATNMRAALDLAGWRSTYQKDFLNYVHAIEETARKAKKNLTRPRKRPRRSYKHRAIEAMKTIKVPKHLRHHLLTDIGL